MVRTLNAQIKRARAARSARQVRAHPDGPIFLSLFKSPDSVITAAELLAEIGDCRERYPDRRRARRRRRPSRRRDRVGQMEDRRLPTGLQQAPARRVLPARGQQPPLAPLGRRPLRRKRASAATSTPARSAPSDAPGAASCGNAGATTPHTTPPATARCNATSLSPSPPRRAPCPTSPPPSGWPAPLSPNGRPAGPSAQRLTASRHPLPHTEVDVMKGRGRGGPGGRRHPGGRKSALRPEPRS